MGGYCPRPTRQISSSSHWSVTFFLTILQQKIDHFNAVVSFHKNTVLVVLHKKGNDFYDFISDFVKRLQA